MKYRDEEVVLRLSENPEEEYLRHVLPDKIKLAKEYLVRSSFLFDLTLITKTLPRLFWWRVAS
jgi:lipopolysaccharide/colanic/teichoic acid biosynthesis glycosyltransferase